MLFFPLAGIVDTMVSIRHTVVSLGDEITSVALVVAGILAIFRLVVVASEIAKGVETRFMTVLRPFIIIVCISLYPYIVVGPIDLISQTMSNGIFALSGNEEEANLMAFMDAWKVQSEKEGGDKGTSSSGDPKIVPAEDGEGGDEASDAYTPLVPKKKEPGHIARICRAVFGFIVESISYVISGAVKILYSFGLIIFVVYSQIYLALLAIMGSFVFALAVFPELDNIKGWIANYIQVSLWGPLCSLVNLIVQMSIHAASGVEVASFLKLGEVDTYFAAVAVNLVISIAGIIMLLSVPSMAGSIIAATGANSSGSQSLQRLGSIIKFLRKL